MWCDLFYEGAMFSSCSGNFDDQVVLIEHVIKCPLRRIFSNGQFMHTMLRFLHFRNISNTLNQWITFTSQIYHSSSHENFYEKHLLKWKMKKETTAKIHIKDWFDHRKCVNGQTKFPYELQIFMNKLVWFSNWIN